MPVFLLVQLLPLLPLLPLPLLLTNARPRPAGWHAQVRWEMRDSQKNYGLASRPLGKGIPKVLISGVTTATGASHVKRKQSRQGGPNISSRPDEDRARQKVGTSFVVSVSIYLSVFLRPRPRPPRPRAVCFPRPGILGKKQLWSSPYCDII